MLRNQQGSSFAVVLTATLLLAALSLALTHSLDTSQHRLMRATEGNRARYAARAGLEWACLDVLSGKPDWTTLNSGDEWADKELSPGTVFDVSYAPGGTAHRRTVAVTARVGDEERSVDFTVSRGGFGGTIRIESLHDQTLANMVR